MRKFILLTFALLCALSSSAQGETSTSNKNDSISSYIATILEDIDMRILKSEANDRYKFYPTENIYNFLKLSKFNGLWTPIRKGLFLLTMKTSHGAVAVCLNFIQHRICINSFCWIRLMAERGMSNGE